MRSRWETADTETSRIALPCGSLWATARTRAADALAQGALEPIATASESLEHEGVTFQVRRLERAGAKEQAARARGRSRANPFLPYDERLRVCDVSDTHVCLLNRFPVLDGHLLIVTRRFEPQEEPLGLADFAALEACLCEGDALAFYNAGRTAGASQRHRHLQLVPLPLGGGPDRLPVERLLEPATRVGEEPANGVLRSERLPFRHALVRLDARRARAGDAARDALGHYRALRRAAGVRDAAPYNLLVTREWMLLVPRTRESFASIGVNALGFAGALLVRDREQLARLREIGPLGLLAGVAAPGP